jgi:hypothetical protein
LVGFVGFDDASKGVVELRLQGADDRHPPAPDAVMRRAQDRGRAAAGHRLRRLDHVTQQRSHQVWAMHLGERRAAPPRPGRPAARAPPSLCPRARPAPPAALGGAAAWARRCGAARLGAGVDLKDRFGTLSRLGHQSLRLPQLVWCQTGEQVAKLGWIEVGHRGTPGMAAASDTTLLEQKNKGGTNTVY